MKTDHWFYGLFQSAPDLITLLLPVAGPDLGPDAPGDLLYRFEAPELKAANHRLDGVLWPRGSEGGTPDQPVVLLEVQMHSKPGFHHRLAAQSYRFVQQHPEVEHLVVLVVVPHRRLRLGPARLPRLLQVFLGEVVWLSLEELSQQPDLDPLLNLLTLPVRPEAELGSCTQQIVGHRPDLVSAVLPILFERFPTFTPEEIMVIAGFPTDQLRHTRAVQMLLEEGRQEGEALGEARGEARGRALGEASVTLRLLSRRCGLLNEATTARIQALPLEQLEALAEALLDFTGAADLAAWLAEHAG
ncbi:MAG: Rpn family recombination-promoting nuclease/putative transposase [Cyanobacteriota bacterium]